MSLPSRLRALADHHQVRATYGPKRRHLDAILHDTSYFAGVADGLRFAAQEFERHHHRRVVERLRATIEVIRAIASDEPRKKARAKRDGLADGLEEALEIAGALGGRREK